MKVTKKLGCGKERKVVTVFHLLSNGKLESNLRCWKLRKELKSTTGCIAKNVKVLESYPWLWFLLWCFAFFLPGIRSIVKGKPVGPSPAAGAPSCNSRSWGEMELHILHLGSSVLVSSMMLSCAHVPVLASPCPWHRWPTCSMADTLVFVLVLQLPSTEWCFAVWFVCVR